MQLRQRELQMHELHVRRQLPRQGLYLRLQLLQIS